MKARRLLSVAFLLVFGIAGIFSGAPGATGARQTPGPVVVVNLNREIDEISARFLSGALHSAAKEHASAVVIRLDTPGGLISSMWKMVSDIFASPVPVTVWVGPDGAQAASAGTFIAAAAAYLGMAPVSNIGAAAAVDSSGNNLQSTLAKKVNQNDAAKMRSICDRRHRPAKALEATIFKAKSYSAAEAIRLGIANVQSPSLTSFIQTLDGKTLQVSKGTVTVHTAGAPIKTVSMGFWMRLLDALSDPNIVFLLLNLGGLGLIIELWTGGNSWVPGSLGIICLVMAFAGLSVLPFSWAGLALILLGLCFFAIELHAPGHLFFGVTGTASVIFGGVLLFGYYGGPGLPGYTLIVSRWLLFGFGFLVALIAFLLAREVHLSHHGKRYVSPLENKALVGAIADVSTRLAPSGEIWVGGEPWQATLSSGGTAEPGEHVRVTAIEGFRAVVERIEEEKPGRDGAQST